MLPWHICCFFVKHSGRPDISILTTSAPRERRNNAASLNLLKLKHRRFFGSAFSIYVEETTKLFLVIVERNIFSAPEKPSINKFLALLLTWQLLTICNAWSGLDKWIRQELIDWEQRWYNYGGVIFLKYSIVCWLCLLLRLSFWLVPLSILLSTCLTFSSILRPVISNLLCNLSLASVHT